MTNRGLIATGCLLALAAIWLLLPRAESDDQPATSTDFLAVPFARIGDQPHLLVLMPTHQPADEEPPAVTRRVLEQLAANYSWFLYVSHDRSLITPKSLQRFDAVVLNHVERTSLGDPEQRVLQRYTEQGGQLFQVDSPTAAKQIHLKTGD